MGGQDVGAYQRMLEEAVQQKGLQRFFPPGSPNIQRVAQEASQKIPQLCQAWKLTPEIGRDVARLGLYDIILFVGMCRRMPGTQWILAYTEYR